jgi:hypothetical protein
MKNTLLITLMLASQIAIADCSTKSASMLSGEHVVGNIEHYKETITKYRCTVNFRINVDGQWHQVENTQEEDFRNEHALCRDAVRFGKEKLLARLGGNFQTEAITVCKDGQIPNRKIRKGDIIMENEVGTSKIDGYYPYKTFKSCRNFTEQYYESKQLKVYYGVICKVDNVGDNWVVMDKW